MKKVILEIFQEILKKYELAVLKISEDCSNDPFSYITKENIRCGICRYVDSLNLRCDHIQYVDNIIKDHRNYQHSSIFYWFRPPYKCQSVEEIIESLNYRVEKLKEIIKRIEKCSENDILTTSRNLPD